jgi:FtsH-binding integral membrane protein
MPPAHCASGRRNHASAVAGALFLGRRIMETMNMERSGRAMMAIACALAGLMVFVLAVAVTQGQWGQPLQALLVTAMAAELMGLYVLFGGRK